MLFDSTCRAVRTWIQNVPLDGALTVDIIVKLHEGAVRFGDERLKELRGSNTRPRSLRSKYEAESIEQPNLESMCQTGAAMGGMREPALTCQTNGKFLRFARMRTIQRSFQIDEETKVSERTSFPGRVSRESGIAAWCDIQLQRDTSYRFCRMKNSKWIDDCGRRSFVVRSRHSTPSLHINGHISKDIFYTKIDDLSTKRGLFRKSHERRISVN